MISVSNQKVSNNCQEMSGKLFRLTLYDNQRYRNWQIVRIRGSPA